MNVLDVLDVTELYFKITNFILYAFYNYIHNTRIYIPTYIAYIYTYTHTHTHNILSVQFTRSVVSDSLRPHESQHARPPCPSYIQLYIYSPTIYIYMGLP